MRNWGGRIVASALGMLAAGAAGAQDYRPAFRPDMLKGRATGTPNEVLVLGTPHLGEIASLRPAMLEPLLARLAAWKPQAIAVEDLSGLQCDALRRHPSRYAETVATYCPDPAAAGRATGLDVPAANAEADRLLASWPASPTPAQRRRLAAVLMAAGERHSGLVQWLRLTPAERHAGDGLTEALVVELSGLQGRRNETSLISAVLAARLGLERLWSVDDHSADTPEPTDPAEVKAQGEAIMAAWNNPATEARKAAAVQAEAGLGRPEGMLARYRDLNAPAEAMLTFRSDFGAALAEPSPQRFGRRYVGYWETRNLRMVANVRDVLAQAPGTRLLAIVGASHKGYYEAYLNQMHDVRLVDAGVILR